MINVGQAVGYLLLDTTSFTDGLKKARDHLRVFQDSTATAADKFAGVGAALDTTGKVLTKNVTAPLVGLGGLAVKTAVDFESAFTGVRKTVDATEEEFAALDKGIKDMSGRMPQSAAEIAGVMEVAGQLGVRGVDSLLSFTETMIMLGDTTNLSSEEAATSIARVMNIMGTSSEDVSRFGSTIVDLGNNFATTESEIVEMTNRLAAGGRLAGLTEPELMALATAMSSVGIQAEAGGTAMTQTFNEIEKAVAGGGESLDEFARVAGMSSQEFATAWETTPIKAIQSFITGLGRLDEQGESSVLILENLGLTGIRQSNMLKSLALASDMLGDSLDTANAAWAENTALAKEANTRYGTSESSLLMLRNNLQNLAISFGELILPMLNSLVETLQKVVTWLNNLSEEQKKAILRVLEVAAALGPVLLIGGKIATGISKIIGLIGGAGGLSAVIAALSGPIGIVIGVIAALAAAWITDFGNIREYTAEIFGYLKSIFSTVATFLKKVWDENWAGIRDVVVFVWDAVETITRTTFEVLANLFKIFDALLKGDWEGMWEGIKNIAKAAWDALVHIVEGMMNAIWDTMKNIATGIWNGIVGWIDRAIEKVKGFFSFLSGGSSQYSGGMGLKGYQGSYASGLDYVPRDMLVKVHEGERILTKQENAKGISQQPTFGTININIEGAKYSDEKQLAQAIAYEIQHIANRREAVWT